MHDCTSTHAQTSQPLGFVWSARWSRGGLLRWTQKHLHDVEPNECLTLLLGTDTWEQPPVPGFVTLSGCWSVDENQRRNWPELRGRCKTPSKHETWIVVLSQRLCLADVTWYYLSRMETKWQSWWRVGTWARRYFVPSSGGASTDIFPDIPWSESFLWSLKPSNAAQLPPARVAAPHVPA